MRRNFLGQAARGCKFETNFYIAPGRWSGNLARSIWIENSVNAELCKKALEKVGSPNILINIVSRRVRQLNAGGGGMGRPLIADYTNLGAADIAMREIIEEKLGWDVPEIEVLTRPVAKKRKKH
jgi:DNA-directed RNA polymerase subunit omega